MALKKACLSRPFPPVRQSSWSCLVLAPLSRLLHCIPLRSWMGFQTLVILQGQAPDTPTLLEAFLPQEAGGNNKSMQPERRLLGECFMLKTEILGCCWWMGKMASSHECKNKSKLMYRTGNNVAVSNSEMSGFVYTYSTQERCWVFSWNHLPLCGHYFMWRLNPQLCYYLLRILHMLFRQSTGFPTNPAGLASAGDLWVASGQLTHW